MNFWDSSAIIPLIIEQSFTAQAEKCYATSSEGIFVWWGTLVECVSAISRLERDGELAFDEAERGLKALQAISNSWCEILPSDIVRDKACRLLRVHPLRTAEAFQLASAIVASEDKPANMRLVTFDNRLAVAAQKEGFEVCN